MYAIYGNIYHQHTPNVSIYTIHGSYGSDKTIQNGMIRRMGQRNPAPPLVETLIYSGLKHHRFQLVIRISLAHPPVFIRWEKIFVISDRRRMGS